MANRNFKDIKHTEWYYWGKDHENCEIKETHNFLMKNEMAGEKYKFKSTVDSSSYDETSFVVEEDIEKIESSGGGSSGGSSGTSKWITMYNSTGSPKTFNFSPTINGEWSSYTVNGSSNTLPAGNPGSTRITITGGSYKSSKNCNVFSKDSGSVTFSFSEGSGVMTVGV